MSFPPTPSAFLPLPLPALQPHIRYAVYFRVRGPGFPAGTLHNPVSILLPLEHWRLGDDADAAGTRGSGGGSGRWAGVSGGDGGGGAWGGGGGGGRGVWGGSGSPASAATLLPALEDAERAEWELALAAAADNDYTVPDVFKHRG